MSRPVDYVVGLDVGQLQDFSAVCVLEELVWIGSADEYWQTMPMTETGWVSPDQLQPSQTVKARALACKYGWPHRPELHVSHLERLPLRMPYPRMIEHVTALMNRPPLAGRSRLVVDATGVGKPVVDALKDAGLNPVAVTITGGGSVTYGRGGYSTPKRDLIAASQIALQSRRLVIAAGLPETETLVKELQDYRVEISEATGHDSYNARSGRHDDLVLAVSLAVWYRDYQMRLWDRQAMNAGKKSVKNVERLRR